VNPLRCVIIFVMLSSGEEKAWEMLISLDPSDVRRKASVSYDKNLNHYVLRSFCSDFYIQPETKTIHGSDPTGDFILKRYGYFFTHSCLWYLIHAKDLSLTERLIKPVNIPGGEMFFRGSHVLPLDNLADKYGADRDNFLKRGKELCAKILPYGDTSVKLLPMPRIPVILILWLKDEEFPPRADLLLDSTCEMQLPLDIIWSISMLSVLVMT